MAQHMDRAKVTDKIRRLEKTANIAAWVILKDGKYAGRILQKYLDRCTMAALDLSRPLHDEDGNHNRWQIGWASGGGYNKATAVLDGMTFNGHTFTDEGKTWDAQLQDWGFEVIRAI